jgi:glutathione synthase/RimK-type ligase-like ATP-grasp enzyme
MNVVIIYYTEDTKKRKPAMDKGYQGSYEFLYLLGKKKGVNFFRAPISQYRGNGLFEMGWTFDKRLGWQKVGEIRADVVFDKCKETKKSSELKRKMFGEVPMINNPALSAVCNDKYWTYRNFKQLSPQSFLIKGTTDLKRFLLKVDSEKAVLKPVGGVGGCGILIGSKEKLASAKLGKGDYLLQEYVDTSSGVKGLIRGVHDLRMVGINGKILYSFFRKPKVGSLLCNITQGGTAHYISNSRIPLKAKKIFRDVDKKFKKFGNRLISVDLFFSGSRPYLVEFNSTPLIHIPAHKSDLRKKYYSELIKIFKKIAH